MINIKSRDTSGIQIYLQSLAIPSAKSHKGQNGKVLVIGGSHLFHAASIWAAEVASHFADMVHYCSTAENNEIMRSLKTSFRNGIVVPRSVMRDYVQEDDAILIGPGMVRTGDEATVTETVTRSLLETFPMKRFVLDAGALQMMKAEWLIDMKEKTIVTPHQQEFAQLFGRDVTDLSLEEKAQAVSAAARAHNTVILLKAIVDIVSDGDETIIIEGGNAGLTKGGTGDILAGLVTALRSKNDPVTSAVLGSFLLKRAGDELFQKKGTWYNNSDLIGSIPEVLNSLL
jgi:NAD(P)H-hydrate epimerase